MLSVTIKPVLPTIQILLPGIEEHILIYDRVQVFRSLDNITFTEITGDDITPPKIIGTVAGPFNLTNKTLTIQKEAKSWSIPFTGTLDTLSLLKQINTAVGFVLATNDTNHIVLTDNVKGTGSWMQIGGDAAPVIGLSTTKLYGLGARPYLTVPTTVYTVYDLSDVTSAYYKLRLLATKTGRVSAYSETVQYPPPKIIQDSDMVTGSLKLATASGDPIANNEIIITPILYKTVSGVSVLNSHEQLETKTDNKGEASIKLLKGAQVRVDIVGTALGREITVPTADFNILQVLSIAPDPLSISPAPTYPIVTS
jgi:hypothetical protein